MVNFHVLYTIPTGAKRDYGIVSLPKGPQFPDQSVAEGWLKLRDDAAKKDDSDDSATLLSKLEALQSKAKAESKGLWKNGGGGIIETIYELSDPQQLIEEWKEKSLEGMFCDRILLHKIADHSAAIIEKVLSGDRLIARLLLNPKKHVQTMLLIAGIRAPSTKRTNTSDGKEQPAEPFGEDAQRFVESRLLQRNAAVTLLGVSPQNQLVGVVKHPVHGSIAPYVLEAGLARCMDHHSTMLGSEMGALRQAEKRAREKKVGLFHGTTSKSSNASEADAVVSRIQTADCVYIRNKAGSEKRVSLSSVRQPKPTDPKQAPWAPEAKEFLRKKLIGKHVKVSINGKRPAQEGYDEREMATITINGNNVAMLLVENGFASVIRHRQDDTDRSPIYDDLLLAEKTAQDGGKGMWGPKPPAAKQYVDYSESLEKAKRQMSLLSRQKKVPAVVDYVKSGSRFTVLVPRESAKLTFLLSGVRAPKSARNANEKSEPFGQEAHDFANRRCLQRDVEIDVEDTDKVGGFIGSLYVNRESFAKLLVEEGFASVHTYSAEKSGNANELLAAESRAKEARKGMWHDWSPTQEADGEAPAANDATDGANGDAKEPATRPPDYRDVVVTHVDDAGRFKLQQIGTGTAALTELMSSFRTFHLNKANDTPLSGPPKAGDFVAARFSEDNEWYRARIRRNDREAKKSEVVYIDFGNSETIPWSRLRPLTQPQFSAQKLRPQAIDAVLSFVQLPAAANYLQDSVAFVHDRTDGRQLVASVDNIAQDGTLHVTLYDSETKADLGKSLNADLVGEGLAMAPRKLKGWERGSDFSKVTDILKKREEEAKEARLGMWEYGDLTEDD